MIESCINYIDFEVVNEQTGCWRYTGYYGYPERNRRLESWNMLRELAGKSMLSWCIIGDFNDLLTRDEKRGGKAHPRHLPEGFAETLVDCGLTDLGFTGEKYTWKKSRGTNRWIQERLDKGMESTHWRELFPKAEVKVLKSQVQTAYRCICS